MDEKEKVKPLTGDPNRFWTSARIPPNDLLDGLDVERDPVRLLKMLGNPPGWEGSSSPSDVLAQTYRSASLTGKSIALDPEKNNALEKRKERRNEAQKKYKAKNPERVREAVRKWRAANAEHVKESAKKHRVANSERIKEGIKKWRAANPDKARQTKEYRAANAERIKERMKKWRAANTRTKGNQGVGHAPKRPLR